MHKLKPILVHRFWILFALALILPVFGWFQTNGRLAAETKTRREAIDKKEKAIPKGTDLPTDHWVTEATQMVERQAQLQHRLHAEHWARQQKYMVWHPIIAEQVAKVPYRGEIRNREREQFRSGLYLESAAEVWRIVNPYDPSTERGLVVCPESMLGFIPSDRWARNAPSSAEIWDAQEDLWLTASLLSAIAKVNETVVEGAGHSGAPLSITEAPVRAVEQFRLHGGVRSPPRRRMWAVSRTPAPSASPDGGAPPPGEPPPEGAAPTGGGSPVAGGPVGVDFEPSEEYDGIAGDPATEGNHDRYIDVNYATIPFRTRGFYLRLKMDQRHVPELLVALANLPWDVRIGRMNQQDVATDPIDADPSGRQAGPGTARPRPPATGGGSRPNVQQATGVAEKALADPYIVVVTIGGALTLYNKPTATLDPNAPTDPAATPPVDGGAPAGGTPTGTPPAGTPDVTGTSPPAGTAPPADSAPAGTATPPPADGAAPAGTPAAPSGTPATPTGTPATTPAPASGTSARPAGREDRSRSLGATRPATDGSLRGAIGLDRDAGRLETRIANAGADSGNFGAGGASHVRTGGCRAGSPFRRPLLGGSSA